MINENTAMAQLSERLALACGYNPTCATQIRVAATLHDIGKRCISKEILEKPGKLTPQEFEIVKKHTIYGANYCKFMLSGELRKMARDVALLHHEWYNGNGYWGHEASKLPQFIGIVAICDVYCALVYKRVYKPSWTVDESISYIRNQAGTQFCPRLVDTFLSLICA